MTGGLGGGGQEATSTSVPETPKPGSLLGTGDRAMPVAQKTPSSISSISNIDKLPW